MTDLENHSPRRTPSMYHFYKTKLEEAIQTNSWGHFDEIVEDLPEDIKQELILNGVLEESLEDSRDGQPDWQQDFGEVYDDEPNRL